jgi:S-adenosyl-L-methionine hydrolase (adenosine-forming)
MKIALLSDIHGNFHALTAVLRHARGRGAMGIALNLGDSIGYGPDPEAVAQQIQGSHFINILGNYDKNVLSKKFRKARWQHVKTPEKRAMFAWTFKALSKQSRKYLKSLPESRSIAIGGIKIMMTHGSPASHVEHLRPETPEKRLAELASQVNSKIVLCGHSHYAFSREVNTVLFINPGSVGRPDDGDPRASYAILEVKDGQVDVQFYRVSYDILATVEALRQMGLPNVFAEVFRQGLNFKDVVAKLGNPPKGFGLEPSGTLTLLTDFGLQDHFIGVMKGVIVDIAPQLRLIDISHQIHPQNIFEGARILAEAARYFSAGTVHVAVVDPGVGTQRRAIAAQIGSQFFVAPDNGLLSLIIQRAQQEGQPVNIVTLNQSQYWLPEPSHTFHGRDIFAPVGAHLANGLPLEKLGDLIDDPILLDFPIPEHTPTGWQGEVVMVDVFGNLSTNLPCEILPDDLGDITVNVQGETIRGLTRAFGDATPNSLIAIIDSTGHLAISVVAGSAAERLAVDVGAPVMIMIDT